MSVYDKTTFNSGTNGANADTYDEGNGAWSVLDGIGHFVFQDGRVYYATSDQVCHLAAPGSPTLVHGFSARLDKLSTDNFFLALGTLMSGSSAGYIAIMNGTGGAALYKRDLSGAITGGGGLSFTPVSQNIVTLIVTNPGGTKTLTLYHNGVQIGQGTDATGSTSGKDGLVGGEPEMTSTTGMHVNCTLSFSGASISPDIAEIENGSTGNVVTITGNQDCAWVSMNPTFLLSGGTGASIAAINIVDDQTAELTITAGSANGTLTITDPVTLSTTTVDVTTASATSFTMTGPSPLNGEEGVASGDFTLNADGPTSAAVTLGDGSETGTFTPSSPNLDGTNDVTFTYTPAVTGTRRNITISASAGGLTPPSNLAYEAWVHQVVTVTPGGPVDLSNSATQQFTKGVTGGPTGESSAGTWSVESGGGSVNSSGLYTAPSSGTGSAVVRFTHTASGEFDEVTVNYAPGIAVAVSPGTATVDQEDTQQFTANVTGETSDDSVTWTVEEVGGGTIDSNGLYTAPTTPGTYHVTATSVEDPTKSDTATVTVPAVAVDVTPNSATIEPDATQQFDATVTGTVNTAVDWQVNEVDGGTVDSTGLYTAPSTPGTYTVTATSEADPSASETVTITVAAAAVSVIKAYADNAVPTGEPVLRIKNIAGEYHNGTSFEVYNSSNVASYAIAATNIVGTEYQGVYPEGLPDGLYDIALLDKQDIGGDLVESDFDLVHVLDRFEVTIKNGNEQGWGVPASGGLTTQQATKLNTIAERIVMFGDTTKVSENSTTEVWDFTLGSTTIRATIDKTTGERTMEVQ